MEKKLIVFFVVYYCIVILFALYNLYLHFSNPITVTEAAYYIGFQPHFFVGLLIVLLSAISLFIVIKNKFPKITWVYPIYSLIFFIIWLNLVPIIISTVVKDFDKALSILDRQSVYDWLTYFFDIGFSSYMLFWFTKKKNK